MGQLTLAEIRSELRLDLRNRPDTSSSGFSDTRANLYINSAYLHLTHPSVFRHRQLLYRFAIPLTTANLYTFSPDGAGVTITALLGLTHVQAATNNYTASRTKLLPKDEQWFDDRSHNQGPNPRHYAVRGDQILLSPIPNGTAIGQVLSVHSYRQPALLALDTDTTVMDTRFDEILLLAARWRAELHLGYRDLSEATKLDFVGLLNEYRDHDTLNAEDFDWQADVRTYDSPMEQA